MSLNWYWWFTLRDWDGVVVDNEFRFFGHYIVVTVG